MLAWGWAGGLVGGSEIWGAAAGSGRWHVGIAIGVTAMAGLALAATLVVSSRRGSLKSPWSRRKRTRALSRRMWNSFFSPDGKLRDGGVKFLKKARSGGIDPSIRADVWPFLLGVYELNSTEAERSCVARQKRAEYEMLRKRCRRLLNFHDKVNGLKGTGLISHKGSSTLKQEPESPASGDLSVKSPLATDEGSGLDDQPVFDKPPNGNACYVEKLSGNADQTLDDGTPDSSTCKKVEDQRECDKSPDGNACNVEGVCGNDDQPVYDRTPESKTCKTDTGSSSYGQPVYDSTPDSCTPNVEEDRIKITLFDASGISTCKIDGCSARGQPIYNKTPESYVSTMEEDRNDITHPDGSDSSSCKMDGGSSSQDHPVYDQTPDPYASNVEEDGSGITHVDVSAMDTESSESDSSAEEDDEGMLEPFTEGCLGPDPKYVKLASLKGDLSNRMAEDFATWQRIIRLDAVRANPEWVVYSPNQATVSEDKANESAIAVGLKDYDHLEPCMIYHAARLVAVLEAYALYDPDIGYCQGMSDLLSPIIAVIEEDHEAFWCFVGFMRKARHNFRLDEVGIRRQLSIVAKIIKSKDLHLYRHLEKMQAEDCFFVYRMVVVLFRRELGFEQTVCLWEVMWADQAAIRAGIGKSGWGRIRLRAPPTDDLLLYAIAACVLQRRKLIIEKYCSMDEILRECNNMAGQLDVWRLLDDAHDLVVTLHDKI